MRYVNISQARAQFDRLMEEVANTHEPILIRGKRHNAVLLSEADWQAMQETLHLLAIPGMRESIHEGVNTPLDQCNGAMDG